MEKEFIPYEEALAMKELGFDEPCLAFYNLFSGRIPTIPTIFMQEGMRVNDCYWIKNSGTNTSTCPDEYVAAPLYQQAFDWFRKEHNLFHNIRIGFGSPKWYDWVIQNITNSDFYEEEDKSYNTYEESRLASLQKLIELVAN